MTRFERKVKHCKTLLVRHGNLMQFHFENNSHAGWAKHFWGFTLKDVRNVLNRTRKQLAKVEGDVITRAADELNALELKSAYAKYEWEREERERKLAAFFGPSQREKQDEKE